MTIKLSKFSIELFRDLITGDSKITLYKSGYELINFFNKLGFADEYTKAFPRRWEYTERKLRHYNNTPTMEQCLKEFFKEVTENYNEVKCHKIINTFNKFIYSDGYQVTLEKSCVRIIPLQKQQATYENSPVSLDYIVQESEICYEVIESQNYDEATRVSYNLLHTTLTKIYFDMHKTTSEIKDMDVLQLFNYIQTELQVSFEFISDTVLKQILQSMAGIVIGMSSLKKAVPERKAYTIKKHHALFALDCSKTISEFLVRSYTYRKQLETMGTRDAS